MELRGCGGFGLLLAQLLPGLAARQLPFLQIDLAVAIEVEARQQSGLVRFPVLQQFGQSPRFADWAVQRAIQRAQGAEVAQHIDRVMRQQGPERVAPLVPLGDLAPLYQYLGRFRVNQAAAAAVVEQEAGLALLQALLLPFAFLVLLFGQQAPPEHGQPVQRRQQGQSGQRLPPPAQLGIALRGRSDARGRCVIDQPGVAQRAPEAEQRAAQQQRQRRPGWPTQFRVQGPGQQRELQPGQAQPQAVAQQER